MSARLGGDTFNYQAARELAYNAPPAATKTTLEAHGTQEELNQAFQDISNQLSSASAGLSGAAASAKRAALQKKIAGYLFKHFFAVYETGFALSQQWADMEANV